MSQMYDLCVPPSALLWHCKKILGALFVSCTALFSVSFWEDRKILTKKLGAGCMFLENNAYWPENVHNDWKMYNIWSYIHICGTPSPHSPWRSVDKHNGQLLMHINLSAYISLIERRRENECVVYNAVLYRTIRPNLYLRRLTAVTLGCAFGGTFSYTGYAYMLTRFIYVSVQLIQSLTYYCIWLCMMRCQLQIL